MSYVIDVWVPDTLTTYDVQIVATGQTGPRGAQGPAGTGIEALTTKGDLLGYSTTGTRIPVGTNGHVLTADSAQALGLKWAAPDVTQAELDAVASAASSALSSHESDTTSVHGLTDTSAILLKTLVDAKGDLIVASAADTPARLAVGTDGQVLTADSAEATGVKWAAASGGSSFATTTAPSASWTGPTRFSTPTVSHGNGQLHLVPYYFDRAVTVTKLGIQCDTAAALGTATLGLYEHDTATGLPSTLIYDAGSVACSSTGRKIITLAVAQSVGPGIVWAGCLTLGAVISVWGCSSNSTGFMGGSSGYHNDTSTTFNHTNKWPVQSSLSALPATFTVSSWASDPMATFVGLQ